MGADKKRPGGSKSAKKKKAEEEASTAASTLTASLEERRVAALEQMASAHTGMQRDSATANQLRTEANNLRTQANLLKEIKALTNEAAIFQSLGMLDAARGCMIQVAAKRGLLQEAPAPAPPAAPAPAPPVAAPVPAAIDAPMPPLFGQIELTEQEKEEVDEENVV